MPDPAPHLSTCSMAMLAALVTHGASDPSELLAVVPPASEITAWFDELQALLDAGFVKRVPRPGRYAYLATPAGSDFLFAHVVVPSRRASA